MPGAWRILDLTTFSGRMESSRGQVLVCPQDAEPATVPVDNLAVVLIGASVSLSGSVLHRLMSAGVAVLLCDWRGVPEGGAYGWGSHTRIGARQLAQANVSVPRRKNLWGKLVEAKVAGQAQVLSNLGRSGATEIGALAKSVRSGDPGNVEAQAARLYWARLFGSHFARDPRRGVGVNACLDYGYMILRGHGIRGVLAAGMIPSLGVFHRGRGNPFNLVDDLIEPFRPAIDEAVAMLDPSDSPSEPHVKKHLVAAADQAFVDGWSVSTALDHLSQQVGMYFEGDLDKVVVPRWKGPSELQVGDCDAG